MSRSSAYELIQSISFSLQPGEFLKDELLKNEKILKYLTPDEIKAQFSLKIRQKQIALRVKAILKNNTKIIFFSINQVGAFNPSLLNHL